MATERLSVQPATACTYMTLDKGDGLTQIQPLYCTGIIPGV
jgi:hypothetical protein